MKITKFLSITEITVHTASQATKHMQHIEGSLHYLIHADRIILETEPLGRKAQATSQQVVCTFWEEGIKIHLYR